MRTLKTYHCKGGEMEAIIWQERVQDYLRAVLHAESFHLGVGIEIPVLLLDQAMNLIICHQVSSALQNNDAWDHFIQYFRFQDGQGLNGRERLLLRSLRGVRNEFVHMLHPDPQLFPPRQSPAGRKHKIAAQSQPLNGIAMTRLSRLSEWVWIVVACAERSGIPLLPDALEKKIDFPALALLESATWACVESSKALWNVRLAEVMQKHRESGGRGSTAILDEPEYPIIEYEFEPDDFIERSIVVPAGQLTFEEGIRWNTNHIDVVYYPLGYGEVAQRLGSRVRFRGVFSEYADFLWSDFPWNAAVKRS